MRIAHVITRLILGGAQENTVLTCEDLIHRHGDDVLLITGPPLGPEGSLLDRARAGGVPVEIIPALRRPIHPWRDAVAYRDLKRAIQRFRPDVVHTHSAKGGILGRVAAWSLGVPAVIHTVHGSPFFPDQGRAGRWFVTACERWAARRCHALVGVADAMTDVMVAAGIAPREKFATVYSGMEVDPFLRSAEHRDRVRRELGYRPDDVVVGKIARLFRHKGHDDVIQAARLMLGKSVRDLPPERNRLPDRPDRSCAIRVPDTFLSANVRFLFVGDGIFRERLMREVAAAGMADRFQFIGLVPPERIPELISAMDIVVHASLREGLARVLPQALLSGKPAVSYDVDGAREVIVSGETGFLIPPRDVEQMAEKLALLAGDPALRDRLGAEGRRRCEQVFRHEHMTEQLRTLYRQLLEKRFEMKRSNQTKARITPA